MYVVVCFGTLPLAPKTIWGKMTSIYRLAVNVNSRNLLYQLENTPT